MSEDANRIVQTTFTINDKTAAPLRMLESRVQTTGQVLGNAVSGFGVLQNALSSTGSVISSVVSSALSPLGMALGALGGILTGGKIASVGSSFEDMQIGLAQTLKFMGQGGDTFGDAMSNAKDVMKDVVREAGPLPGAAMDYVKALQLAGSSVNNATGDYEQSWHLIRQMTAAMGGDGVAAAKDLNQALQGGHGALEQINQSHQLLLQNMHKVKGNEGLTIQQFNAKTLAQRLDLVTSAVALFDDKIAAMSNTFTAVSGAAESTFEMLFRESTAPLFEGMKQGLIGFVEIMQDSEGNWTPLAQSIISTSALIGDTLVNAGKRAAEAFGGLRDMLAEIGQSDIVKHLMATGAALSAPQSAAHGIGETFDQDTRQALSGYQVGVSPTEQTTTAVQLNLQETGATFVETLQSITNSLDSLSVLWDPLMLAVEKFSDSFTHVTDVILPAFADVFDTTIDAFIQVGKAGIEFYEALLPLYTSIMDMVVPAFVYMYDTLMAAVEPLITDFINFSTNLVTDLTPSVLWLVQNLTDLTHTLTDLFADAVKDTGNILRLFYDLMSVTVIPMLQGLVTVLGGLIWAVSAFLKVLGGAEKEHGMQVGSASNAVNAQFEEQFGRPHERHSNRDAMMMRTLLAAQNATPSEMPKGFGGHGTPSSRGGGGGVTQDFRYSKFDIHQKFAEGYDPDRVSTAITEDLGRAGEHKLQSGFAPMFGLR